MNNLNLIVVFFCIIFSTQAHEEPSKTLFEKKEKEKVRVEYMYDKSGNMLSDRDYSPDGKMTEKNLYNYDNKGRVISGNFSDDRDQIIDHFIIEKSSDKKQVDFVKYKAGDSLDYRIVYKYATDYDQSDYTEAIKFNSAKEIILKAVKKYNKQGMAFEKQIYKSDLTLDYTFNYEYDDNGLRVKIVKTKADGLTDWYELYLYDIKGNVSEINRYDSSGKLTYTIRFMFEYYD
jgi:hypothetical protein